MIDWIASPYLALLTLVGIATLARLRNTHWLAPSLFAPMFWCIFMALPLIFAPNYPVSSLAAWTIVGFIFCMHWGALLGERKSIRAVQLHNLRRFIQDQQFSTWVLRAVIAFAILACLSPIFLGRSSMSSSNLPYSVEGMLAMGRLQSIDRYTGGQEPGIVRFFIAWTYPAALLGGLVFPLLSTLRSKILSFAGLVPALLFGAILAARAGIVLATFCWISGYLAMTMLKAGESYRPITRRTILHIFLAVSATVGLFIIIDAIRGFTYGSSFGIVPDPLRIQSTFFGYLPAFSWWLEVGRSDDLTYGAFTFAGLFDVLGLSPRNIGLYRQFVVLEGDISTNIYTAFRGLIQDFSIPGSLIISFLFGFFSGCAYRNVLRGHTMWVLGLTLTYVSILWSPVVAIFTYNGPLFAWIVGWGVLMLTQNRICVMVEHLPVSGFNPQRSTNA